MLCVTSTTHEKDKVWTRKFIIFVKVYISNKTLQNCVSFYLKYPKKTNVKLDPKQTHATVSSRDFGTSANRESQENLQTLYLSKYQKPIQCFIHYPCTLYCGWRCFLSQDSRLLAPFTSKILLTKSEMNTSASWMYHNMARHTSSWHVGVILICRNVLWRTRVCSY